MLPSALLVRPYNPKGLALTPGTRLGVYHITAQIGVGGMGEVYQATDTNLKRQVAIKVLPAAVAGDADRLTRFQREAEVLAALNHPNIAQIYGLEKSDGTIALVMELVEGPNLADRIAQGAIPIDEALPIAKQLAEALEAAHEQGIIHRDLKPANIKVRPDGTVKVLDFGLAKAMEPTGAMSPSVSQSPTITSPAMMTAVGVLLGTAAYMSPEQGRGRAVDKRSDIWAFGCVLFEMLTGKRAFVGDDVSDTLAAVLRAEPDWNRLPADAPRSVRLLLRRCLHKDPKERLQDIGDARIEVRDAQAKTDAEITIVPSPVSVRRRERIAWTLLALSTFALALLAMLYLRRAVPEPVVTRLDIVTPPTTDPFSFAVSPDGRKLVFVANGDSGPQLWVRPLDQAAAQPLAGTEGAGTPFWAPDSRAVAFFADGRLKRLDLGAGTPEVVTIAPQGRGGTWNRDGVIVFAPNANTALLQVPANGGTPAAVTRLGTGHGSHRWPQFLPDGRRFLFYVGLGQVEPRGVYIASLDGGEPQRLLATDTAAYASAGHLLRVSQGVLLAQPFDAATAAVTGEPVAVAQAVGTDTTVAQGAFSISAGALAHRSGASVARRQLAWFDRTGRVVGALGPPDDTAPTSPSLAPDGQRAAVGRFPPQASPDVWLIDVTRGVVTRLTFDDAIDLTPIWSPDASRIVFRSSRNGAYDLFEKPANGAGAEQPLLVSPQSKAPLDWSRDGRFLLYSVADDKTGTDLWALPLNAERKPFVVAHSTFEEMQGQFSPDGRWLAYAANESGQFEVYVRPFPEDGGKWLVSTAGGTQPRWGRNGQELFYVAPDGQLMAAPISAGQNAIEAGRPVPLFATRFATGANVATSGFNSTAQYAVATDGRFLMNVSAADAATATPINIVLNWAVALGR